MHNDDLFDHTRGYTLCTQYNPIAEAVIRAFYPHLDEGAREAVQQLQLPEKLESKRLRGPDCFYPRCFVYDSSGAYKLIQEYR